MLAPLIATSEWFSSACASSLFPESDDFLASYIAYGPMKPALFCLLFFLPAHFDFGHHNGVAFHITGEPHRMTRMLL